MREASLTFDCCKVKPWRCRHGSICRDTRRIESISWKSSLSEGTIGVSFNLPRELVRLLRWNERVRGNLLQNLVTRLEEIQFATVICLNLSTSVRWESKKTFDISRIGFRESTWKILRVSSVTSSSIWLYFNSSVTCYSTLSFLFNIINSLDNFYKRVNKYFNCTPTALVRDTGKNLKNVKTMLQRVEEAQDKLQ